MADITKSPSSYCAVRLEIVKPAVKSAVHLHNWTLEHKVPGSIDSSR